MTKCSAESLSLTALANNQVSGYSYDAAGNMTWDATDQVTAVYDPENRIATATKSGITTSYSYDADDNRVEKSNGSAGTLYWYMTPGIEAESDPNGNLQSEYVFFGGERIARKDFPSKAVSYYFSDHLKTTNIITDAAGNIKSESDYYPWGGELPFLANDSNHYKFTGKERDNETGLDLMGARYYSNGLGRFVQADPLSIEMHRMADPQQLNLYAYGRDNPLRFNDPTGLDIWLTCEGGQGDCSTAVNQLNGRENGQFNVGLDSNNRLTPGNADPTMLSESELALYNAITDPNNHATVNVVGDTGQSEFGQHDGKGENTIDLGNLSKLDAATNKGGLNSGTAIAHEAMDAYLSLSKAEPAADRAAAALYPGLGGPTNNQNTLNPLGTRVLGSTFNQTIQDGRGTERVTIKYITPIPASAVDPRFNSLERRNEAVHDAGSRVTEVTFEKPKQ